MTDKTEKFLKIISIALPTAVILILAVVIGLFLSSAFRIFDMVHDDTQESIPEDTRSKVSFQGIEIPVPDNVVVDRTASVKGFLTDFDWNNTDPTVFIEGIRRSHAENAESLSLQDLTAYEMKDFIREVVNGDGNLEDDRMLSSCHTFYPIEILIPIDDYNALAVYRLKDGDREVYVYLDCVCVPGNDEEKGGWRHNAIVFYATERITYADMASLQVGDSVQKAAELCPALVVQLENAGMVSPLVIMTEEGMLLVYIDYTDSDDSPDEKNLNEWMAGKQIEKLQFIPFGNVLTEEEKAAMIEQDLGNTFFMRYSSIPYILLPE